MSAKDTEQWLSFSVEITDPILLVTDEDREEGLTPERVRDSVASRLAGALGMMGGGCSTRTANIVSVRLLTPETAQTIREEVSRRSAKFKGLVIKEITEEATA